MCRRLSTVLDDLPKDVSQYILDTLRYHHNALQGFLEKGEVMAQFNYY